MEITINKAVFKLFPELESERLHFRKVLMKDAKDIHFVRSNDEVMEFMDVTRTKSVNDAKVLIRDLHQDFRKKHGLSWAIVEKSSNNFMGYIGYFRMQPQHCRGEVGYVLKPEYWGKGFMTEALTTIVRFGFSKMNLHSIEANVNPKNKNSIKLLEKLGFKKEAYFKENYLYDGKFLDSAIYSLLEKRFTRVEG